MEPGAEPPVFTTAAAEACDASSVPGDLLTNSSAAATTSSDESRIAFARCGFRRA